MRKPAIIRVAAGALAVSALACPMLRAQEALEPMAGTGGVMRDAERRAMASAPVSNESPEVRTPSADQASGALSEETKTAVIGPVAAVKVFGSIAFAEEHDIAGRVLAALGGGGDKTVGDILAALDSVRSQLLKEGFYLADLMLTRTGSYDKATKTLSVLVDEGRFGELTIRFDEDKDGTWFSSRQINRRFKTIREGETFDYTRLRRALFDANSHPDLTIDTDISVRKPIEGEGADRRVARYADLDLNVHESVPFHAVWEINNYGLRDVNMWQMSLTAQYLNLTKHDDVLTISPAMSLKAELVSCAGSYMLPHEWLLGGNTTVYGGWSHVDVDDIIPTLDLEGTGYFLGVQHSENLYDSDAHLVALSLGILWRYIEDRYTVASHKLNERGTHILPVTLALSYTGKQSDILGGRNFATVQGVYNLMDSGDEIDKTWNGADDDYWILRAQLARLQPLFGFAGADEQINHNWQLFMKLEGQYTDQTLIPTEKLMMGGYNCLRGYRTRGYVGDYGLYGTFELRTPLLVDAVASLFGDRTGKVAFDRIQLLGFWDYGWTAYNHLPAGYDDERFLCSAGFGARVAATKHSQIRFDVAFPLVESKVCEDDDNYDRDMELYFGFQVQF